MKLPVIRFLIKTYLLLARAFIYEFSETKKLFGIVLSTFFIKLFKGLEDSRMSRANLGPVFSIISQCVKSVRIQSYSGLYFPALD